MKYDVPEINPHCYRNNMLSFSLPRADNGEDGPAFPAHGGCGLALW
ncbi:MAG: hypothetical protein HQM09_04180 [Candidatus Riflebacteria bacterium]|nr:hypothetical protein [Candidatus Riflebacteria bacterium]